MKIQHWLLISMRASIPPLFSFGKARASSYERFSTFHGRFYVGRWKRWGLHRTPVGGRHHPGSAA